MDADNQHSPKYINNFIKSHQFYKKRDHLIIGSRILGTPDKTSLNRFFGILFFSFILRKLTNYKLSDCSSGFRLIKLETIKKIKLEQDQYHTCEFILECTKNNLNISEIPVTMKKRSFGSSKKGGDIAYAINFIFSILSSWAR